MIESTSMSEAETDPTISLYKYLLGIFDHGFKNPTESIGWIGLIVYCPSWFGFYNRKKQFKGWKCSMVVKLVDPRNFSQVKRFLLILAVDSHSSWFVSLLLVSLIHVGAPHQVHGISGYRHCYHMQCHMETDQG